MSSKKDLSEWSPGGMCIVWHGCGYVKDHSLRPSRKMSKPFHRGKGSGGWQSLPVMCVVMLIVCSENREKQRWILLFPAWAWQFPREDQPTVLGQEGGHDLFLLGQIFMDMCINILSYLSGSARTIVCGVPELLICGVIVPRRYCHQTRKQIYHESMLG